MFNVVVMFKDGSEVMCKNIEASTELEACTIAKQRQGNQFSIRTAYVAHEETCTCNRCFGWSGEPIK